MMDAFNQVIPGSADRILAMAERQSAHRQEIEGTVVRGNVRNETLGIAAAALVSLAILAAGVFLATAGHDLVGIAFIVADLVALATVYITGRRRSVRELVGKGAERVG